MDLNSPLFDRIRIKQQCEEPRETEGPACEHPGCKGSGLYRAPKGRGQEGRYFQFCLDHVAAYQKDAVIGHRPTWTMGVNPAGREPGEAESVPRDWGYVDPLGILNGENFRQGRRRREPPEPRKPRHTGPVRR